MIYVQPLLIPANTAKIAPVNLPMQLGPGKITKVDVQVPSGVNALAHLQINYGLHQLWPSSDGSDFATGNETISWNEDVDFLQPPFALQLVGWNTDTIYDHTITVRVVVAPVARATNIQDEIAALLKGAS